MSFLKKLIFIFIFFHAFSWSLFAQDGRDQNENNDSLFGFTIGFMVIHAFGGSKKYIESAFVDNNGIIRSENTLQNFNHSLATVTVHWSCQIPFVCPSDDYSILGITAGANNGKVKGTNGTGWALGLTWGFRLRSDNKDKDFLFGIVLGLYFDDSIRMLPDDYRIDFPYLYQPGFPTTTATPDQIIAATSGVERALRTARPGRFGFIGLVVSLNISFGDSESNKQTSNRKNFK